MRLPLVAQLIAQLIAHMVLAKSDLAIASRYAELVTDCALRERIFGRISPSMATPCAAWS